MPRTADKAELWRKDGRVRVVISYGNDYGTGRKWVCWQHPAGRMHTCYLPAWKRWLKGAERIFEL